MAFVKAIAIFISAAFFMFAALFIYQFVVSRSLPPDDYRYVVPYERKWVPPVEEFAPRNEAPIHMIGKTHVI